jgi:hypothetical protein
MIETSRRDAAGELGNHSVNWLAGEDRACLRAECGEVSAV